VLYSRTGRTYGIPPYIQIDNVFYNKLSSITGVLALLISIADWHVRVSKIGVLKMVIFLIHIK